MGIDTAFGRALIDSRPFVTECKTGVMLGRQGMALKPRYYGHIRQALKRNGLSTDVPALLQEDGFSETFFQAVGYPAMQSMDFSDYEGCDYVHDLNNQVPKKLRGKFDLIVDGGTIEHVFNTPQALDNVFHMLNDGGVFISINGMTGWAGHGFYQFSPELVWRYWQDARNCVVHKCMAVPIEPQLATRDVTDTGKTGRRFRATGMEGRWYLYYVIQKTADANNATRITNTSQGDYAVRWNNARTDKSTPAPSADNA